MLCHARHVVCRERFQERAMEPQKLRDTSPFLLFQYMTLVQIGAGMS